MVEFTNEYGDLQHVRDTQEEFVLTVQREDAAIQRDMEVCRQRAEREMNEERIAHQLRILEFNEQSKQFAACQKQYETDEAQRLSHEAEWKQRANNEWLKKLQCIQQLNRQKMAAGNTAAPTAPLPNRLHPPPNKVQAPTQLSNMVLAERQKQAQHRAVVVAKCTAHRQFMADLRNDFAGPQATAMFTEYCQLRDAYCNDYLADSGAFFTHSNLPPPEWSRLLLACLKR